MADSKKTDDAATQTGTNQPQVIVQMMTPQPGETTQGLNEIREGGEFDLQEPDPAHPGKTIKRRVDANGQPIK